MSVRTRSIPKLRLHKPTGQAVVTLSGRDFYLGKFGTPQSQAEYDRLTAEWLANGRTFVPATSDEPADLTVNEMLVAYMRFADGYYRKNGEPTSEPRSIALSIRPLRRLYGHTLAKDFGPLALKAVRQEMVDAKLCRNEVNKRTGRIVRAFKWAVENELIPPAVHHGLKAVSGLRRGRSEAQESEPVNPVPDPHVDAVQPHVSRQVWAMIRLQRLTGMRPGEVTIMRTCDLDTTGRLWVYVPDRHKTEHHGKSRTIYLGPKAQEILRPWLRDDPTAFLFSPQEASEERWAERRARRKTPLTPSQRARSRKVRPKRTPGQVYKPRSYYRAIEYGCKRAGVPNWHPNQLRHSAATMLRKEFGLDVARVILGHSSPAVTEIYAEVDREKAMLVMERVG
jgi:integrase